jgi:hypothetical protein
MASKTLTVKVKITGLRETLAKFRDLPKDASDKLRDESQRLAQFLALKAQSRGFSQGGQAALAASTIKAVRDRVPAIQMGGTKRVGRKGVPVWQIMFGAEFGMNRRSGWYANRKFNGDPGRQYRPHLGQKGYFFFPTVEDNATDISAAWNKAADQIVNDFSEGDAP